MFYISFCFPFLSPCLTLGHILEIIACVLRWSLERLHHPRANHIEVASSVANESIANGNEGGIA